MPTRRCAAVDCGRFVRNGQELCSQHASEDLAALDPVVDDIDPADIEFRRRLALGAYRHLYDEGMPEVIVQAAEEPGLSDEIGILRVVLARLLMGEGDPNQLATSVARVAGVAIQAARAQRVIGGQQGESISDAVNQILAEFGGE